MEKEFQHVVNSRFDVIPVQNAVHIMFHTSLKAVYENVLKTKFKTNAISR